MPNKPKKYKKGKKTKNAVVRYRKSIFTSMKADYTTSFRLTPAVIQNDTTAETRGSIHFHFSQVPGYLVWRNLFDQYRINSVKVIFTPVMTEVQNRPYDDTTTPNIVNLIPNLAVVRDNDDTNTPLAFDNMLQRAHTRTCPATKKQEWSFVPTRLVMVYLNTTSTGYKVDPDTKGWLDCGQPGIPHYGLKYALETGSPAGAFTYRIDISMNISFKNRRD